MHLDFFFVIFVCILSSSRTNFGGFACFSFVLFLVCVQLPTPLKFKGKPYVQSGLTCWLAMLQISLLRTLFVLVEQMRLPAKERARAREQEREREAKTEQKRQVLALDRKCSCKCPIVTAAGGSRVESGRPVGGRIRPPIDRQWPEPFDFFAPHQLFKRHFHIRSCL